VRWLARTRSPDREKARQIYLNSNRSAKLKDIADSLGIAEGTIRGWKNKDKWDNELNGTLPKIRNVPKDKKIIKKTTENKSNELTEKQRLFCLCYVKNFNATTAAINAGYSKETARMIGYENLTKPYIREEIERLKNIKRQSIMINEDDIVERYMQIAFADMTDYAEFGTKEVPDFDSFGKQKVDDKGDPVYRKYDFVDFKNHDQVDGGLICEISVGKSGMKVKLEDRQKALDWLANYFNMDPASKHKQWYDRQRLELEKSKLNPPEENDLPDDGFMDAMKSDVKTIWADEGEPDG